MALSIDPNISITAKENLIEYRVGKFSSLNDLMVSELSASYLTENNDPTVLLELKEASFFKKMEDLLFKKNVHTPVNPSNRYYIANNGYSYLVYIPSFNLNSTKFNIFNRTIASDNFLQTTKKLSGTTNLFATNGSFYGFLNGKVYPGDNDPPTNPNDVIVDGKVYKNNSLLLNSVNMDPSPLGFHIQKSPTSIEFDFGQGDPTGDDGIGALTPILIYNDTYSKVWKYGEENEYEDGYSGVSTGDPGDLAPHLTTRSSTQYKKQNSSQKGKCIVAWHRNRDCVMVIVEGNSYLGNNQNLDFYRDKLFNLGFRDAIGMDGSDSTMLYEFSSKNFLVKPDPYKYKSNIIGVLYKG